MERWLFDLLNHGCANPLFDAVFPVITQGPFLTNVIVGSLLGLLALALARRDAVAVRQAVTAMIVVGLGVALAELIASQTLKPLFGRPRPPVAWGLDQVRLLVGLGPSASFPSGHAANSAAWGVGLARTHPRLARPAMGFAAAIAFSRVYVGVHFVSDVLVGALIGGAIAAGLARLLHERLPVVSWPAGDRPARGAA